MNVPAEIKIGKDMPSSRVTILSGLGNLTGDKVASRNPSTDFRIKD